MATLNPDFAAKSRFNPDANFMGMVYSDQAPVLASEDMEERDMNNHLRAEIVRSMIPSGFTKLGNIDYNFMNLNPNIIRLNSESEAYVNGYKIKIPSIDIKLNAPPTEGEREDLVFLEAWFEEIDSKEVVGKYGNSDLDTVPNTLIDPTVNSETSHRLQLKWKIRVVDGVDFVNFPRDGISVSSGYGWYNNVIPKTTPQGGNVNPLTFDGSRGGSIALTTSFNTISVMNTNGSNLSLDNGLYISGRGTQQSKDILKTYDGYSYAIPMFRIWRRNTEAFSDINPNGGNSLKTINSSFPNYLFKGNIGYITLSADDYSNTLIGESYNLYMNNGYYRFKIMDKKNNNIISILNMGGPNDFGNMVYNWRLYTRPDYLVSYIIDKSDIIDLRHKVSLTGNNYDQLLHESFEKALRGELQTNQYNDVLKTYHGIPKTPIDANTVFYASLDGTEVAEVGGTIGVSSGTVGYTPSPLGLGLGVKTGQFLSKKFPYSDVLTVDCWSTTALLFAIKNNSNQILYVVEIGMLSTNLRSYKSSSGGGGWNANVYPSTGVANYNSGGLNHFRLVLNLNTNKFSTYLNGTTMVNNCNFVNYIYGDISQLEVSFGDLTSYSNYMVNSGTICDLSISNIDRGDVFATLPKDFVDGYARIGNAFNEQRKCYSDALTSEYIQSTIKVNDTSRMYNITQATPGTWKTADSLSVKGLGGEVISGVFDTDTSLARVINVPKDNTFILDRIDGISVNDTFRVIEAYTNIISPSYATVLTIDTITKTITVSATGAGDFSSSYWNGRVSYLVENTVTSSVPILKYLSSGGGGGTPGKMTDITLGTAISGGEPARFMFEYKDGNVLMVTNNEVMVVDPTTKTQIGSTSKVTLSTSGVIQAEYDKTNNIVVLYLVGSGSYNKIVVIDMNSGTSSSLSEQILNSTKGFVLDKTKGIVRYWYLDSGFQYIVSGYYNKGVGGVNWNVVKLDSGTNGNITGGDLNYTYIWIAKTENPNEYISTQMASDKCSINIWTTDDRGTKFVVIAKKTYVYPNNNTPYKILPLGGTRFWIYNENGYQHSIDTTKLDSITVPTRTNSFYTQVILDSNFVLGGSSSNGFGLILNTNDLSVFKNVFPSDMSYSIRSGVKLSNGKIVISEGVSGNGGKFFPGTYVQTGGTPPTAPVLSDVVGTWSNLGTNQATFTFGANASLNTQDLILDYSLIESPGQGAFSDVWYQSLGIQIGDKMLYPNISYHILDDFAGKVSGSVLENPNLFRQFESKTLLKPSEVPPNELSQPYIDVVKSLDGNTASNQSTQGLAYIPVHLFSFNIVDIVERKYGTIPSVDKVKWCKENISETRFDWYGYGDSSKGNKVYIKQYNISVWIVAGGDRFETMGSMLHLIDMSSSGIPNLIDDSGFMHYCAYTDPSDGVKNATIFTDYISLSISLKKPSQEYEVLTPVNIRRDSSDDYIAFVRKETNELRFPLKVPTSASSYGNYVVYQGTGVLPKNYSYPLTDWKVIATSVGTGGYDPKGNAWAKFYKGLYNLPMYSKDDMNKFSGLPMKILGKETSITRVGYHNASVGSYAINLFNPIIGNALSDKYYRGWKMDNFLGFGDVDNGVYGIHPDVQIDGQYYLVAARLVKDSQGNIIMLIARSIGDTLNNDGAANAADTFYISNRPMEV